MLRLLYASQAAPNISIEQVRDILAVAQRHNAAVGLTGVLISGGGMFMQVLEGPEQEVLRVYVKIMEDKRHGNCRLIYISPVGERLFQKWSMGLIESKPLEFQHVTRLTESRQATVESPAFARVMREFLHRLVSGNDHPAA
jgi:FAD-dependent sensor of blue light